MTAPRLSIYRLLMDCFPRSERVRVVMVLIWSLICAVFEVVGTASVLPFMAVVMDPGALDRYAALQRLMSMLNRQTVNERLVLVGVLTAVAIVLSNLASAVALWMQQHFVARTRLRLTSALFNAYLAQPYGFHVRRDAPSLIKVVNGDSESVVSLVNNAVQFVGRLCVILALLGLLLFQNPSVAAWTISVLGGSYLLVYSFVKQRQETLGRLMSSGQAERQRSLQEGLGGIKDLLVFQREADVSNRYARQMALMSSASASNMIAGALPRYFLEPIAFGGLLAVTLALLVTGSGRVATVMPTLALYAFVGYRLLPALQQMFTAAVNVRYALPGLEAFHEDWIETHAAERRTFSTGNTASTPHAADFGAIQFEDVSFRYEGADRAALDHVSFTIRSGESIGFVGRSGSGKSTLADMLLGLYRPASGRIKVAGKLLEGESLKAWQRDVGYVPQHVFLANSTIAENIAFGLPVAEIDRSAVERAASQAQASAFIAALPEGLDTIVGERGIKLSGGQRQRLGIARALYHEPSVLVFDEATSALDGMTEDSVMEAIRDLSSSRTVLLIAHRLRTVEACDRIIMLDAGRIVAEGRYVDLMEQSVPFRALLGLDEDNQSVLMGEASHA